ncbi:hypothetical protein PybrP1_007585 [[Pythium] brassicae (nom. inval.)]|nr:hypothetical protein PybrP1_007585 [[Pythium] brassicae (nom. inval.)]
MAEGERGVLVPSGFALAGPTQRQVKQRDYTTRHQHFRSFDLAQIEKSVLSNVKGTDLNFFQFHHSYPQRRSSGAVERLIGWGHPVLIDKLKRKASSLCIDGTFKCVPRPFHQCVVVMVYNRSSALFLPTIYILCTSRTAQMYRNTLIFVEHLTDGLLKPERVVRSFESPLLDAMLTRFRNA